MQKNEHSKITVFNRTIISFLISGNPSTCFSAKTMFDEQNYYGEPTKTMSRSNIKYQKYSKEFEDNNEEVLFQEESFEPFEFLAIGTFGMELLNTDPPTPTLPMHFENMSYPHTEITEKDLKLINYELEKFLEAEEKENANDTSERSSQASIITLSSTPIEGADTESHMSMVACPLQNYLFATSIELADTDKEVKKEKTSLEELFRRNNIVHDDPTSKCEGAEQPRRRNVAHFMKKVVKKFHSSSSSSTASSKKDADVPVSIKKKLSKALKMFHKKVYPEEMTEKHIAKLKKSKKKDISYEDAYQIAGHNGNNKVALATSKKSKKNTKELSPDGICNGVSTINGGHWIKTDSDCKLKHQSMTSPSVEDSLNLN
ncbi:hypothetical protein BUALT_Bualt04G0175500 [Buddleja alternifolia]|uniref:LAZY1 n=1 Tax=Buddleja alternifolia TaxID=168488 RepID=A0AAV6XPU1_9LAMI|nr:hypothetical protein BUALT_Bualt04G0175500 [Buddleja alternifolia]